VEKDFQSSDILLSKDYSQHSIIYLLRIFGYRQ
jgi:hypothetical protein